MSYVGLGRVFTANMTGNTVLLGLALGQAESEAVVRSSLALVGFLAGVALGALTAHRGRGGGLWPPAVTHTLALEWVLLTAWAVWWYLAGDLDANHAARAALILPSALAMGVLDTKRGRHGVMLVSLTILFAIGILIARLTEVHHASAGFRTLGFFLMVWVSGTIFQQVLRPGRVDSEKLFAALNVYLLLGAAFGVDHRRLGLLLSGLAAAFAGVAGAFIAMIYTLFPAQIFTWVGVIFAVVILGGLGNPLGALIAGLVVGVSESLTMALTEPAWAPLVSFSLLILVLVLRPDRI